jgi:hypothetical protein
MSIQVFFGREEKAEMGHCRASGAKTANRLPNGDFLLPEVVQSYRDKGWLDARFEYTDKYFKAHDSRRRFVDRHGHIHSLGLPDLWLSSDEPALATWLLANVQFCREELKAALDGAKAEKRILLVELIEQALRSAPDDDVDDRRPD